ncbi:hypothetical protein FRC10_006247, partial [Ceratobasidium sp. 414]
IDHYRQAAQLWTGLRSRTPEFKTKRPLKFVDIHDLNSFSSLKPFVRRLTTQELATLSNMPPSGVNQGFCCILCRNYQVFHVFKKLTATLTHMNEV